MLWGNEWLLTIPQLRPLTKEAKHHEAKIEAFAGSERRAALIFLSAADEHQPNAEASNRAEDGADEQGLGFGLIVLHSKGQK